MRKIKHAANMRDLAGIIGADGRRIAEGRLVRGGHLNKINEKEAAYLANELKLKCIVDLRSPSELEEKPDVVPEGVEYLYLPSLTNEQNPSVNSRNRTAELKRIMKQDGGAIGHLSRLYRVMITQDMARKSYRNMILNMLEQKEGAVYWHCTQGKDRTGVAAAVVLLALGVSEAAIIEDYLNEKVRLKVRNAFLTTLVGIVLFNMKARRDLSALMNAKRPCIEAALDELHRVYGDAENYLRQGLGITDEQIFRLREMYLV